MAAARTEAAARVGTRSRLRKDERGVALVMALGMMTVLSAVTIGMFTYATSGARSSYYSAAGARAGALSEAGLNEALATLFKPGVDPSNAYLFCNAGESLPCAPRTGTVDGKTITWTGTLNQSVSPEVWTLTGTDSLRNPTGPSARAITKTAVAQVRATAVYSSALANPLWDFVYVYGTGDPSGCDYNQLNNSTMASPLYVLGNACLFNSAWINGGPLNIGGSLSFNSPQNSVGLSSSPVTTGVHIRGGCRLPGATVFHSPCTAADSVYANPVADTTLNPNPATVTTPQPDWTTWYLHASPGPYHPCITKTGTPPNFDNDAGSASSPDATKENLSVTGAAGVVSLTPSSSYTCWTPTGELSWNATTRALTLNGSIFFDGNLRIDAGGVVTYSGIGALFTSGSLVLKSTNVCAVVAADGRSCDWQPGHWNPNTKFIEFVAGHKAGCCAPDIPAGDVSIELNGIGFQGGMQSTDRVDVSTSSSTEGPLIAHRLTVGQSLNTYPFPTLQNVPVATSGNQPVYAAPQPPQSFTGS
jgi:Tfp pilus assembly protein PilX